VPLALPFDEAIAVHSLERAGMIVARMGAIPEARRHLETAISLAPPEEHLRLHELLGDCNVSGQAALDAYGTALGLWHAQGETVAPLIGARLLRKILIVRTRWQGGVDRRLEEHEMDALRAEARRLVDAAGDEQERWRLRAVDLFWPFWRGSLTAMDEAEGRRLGPAAAAYFEALGDTEAASEALDGYFNVLAMAGAFADAAAVAQRRLALPGLSYLERSDAYTMLAEARCDAGDYAGCIEASRQVVEAPGLVLSQTRFGDSRFGLLAACLSGRWSDLGEFTTWLEESVAAMGGLAGEHVLAPGYFSALHVAAAREDRTTTERALAALERHIGPDPNDMQKALVAAYRDGDIHALDHLTLSLRHGATNYVLALAVMFLSERGAPPQADLLWLAREQAGRVRTDCLMRTLAIAAALAASDAQLAAAIDAAEAHGLVPHAARMRIVLAQRTGDAAHLDRARPVLERLGDHQFLRRLEEVATTLG
jgi:tetratricopeptide (TPR) repeat protein